jgi:hypothetical protein
MAGAQAAAQMKALRIAGMRRRKVTLGSRSTAYGVS